MCCLFYNSSLSLIYYCFTLLLKDIIFEQRGYYFCVVIPWTFAYHYQQDICVCVCVCVRACVCACVRVGVRVVMFSLSSSSFCCTSLVICLSLYIYFSLSFSSFLSLSLSSHSPLLFSSPVNTHPKFICLGPWSTKQFQEKQYLLVLGLFFWWRWMYQWFNDTYKLITTPINYLSRCQRFFHDNSNSVSQDELRFLYVTD